MSLIKEYLRKQASSITPAVVANSTQSYLSFTMTGEYF